MADGQTQALQSTVDRISPELLEQIRHELRAEILQQVRDELARQRAERPRRLALVASKGSLDMAYPPLIMASTAVSLGWEVGIFCTFYGLDIVNRQKLPYLKVSPVGNPAMPAPISQIPVHVPNIVGMLPGMTELATKVMQSWMDRANMLPLKDMIDVTLEGGGHFFACATSMGVMNVKKEDLIDGVEMLGATAFLEFASEADVALFI